MARTVAWRTALLGCLGLGALMPALPVQAAPILSGGLSYSYDDNLPNGKFSQDLKGDHYLTLELTGGRYFQLDSRWGLSLTADLAATRHRTYSLLNHNTLGASAVLRRKFGLGPLAPLATASASASYLDSQHEPRDRWIYRAGLGLHKRLSSRLDVSLNYDFLQSKADRVEAIPFLVDNFGIGGDVYDHQTDRLSATLAFSATERLSAYGGYARQKGTIVSSTLRNREIFLISDGIAADPAFGPDVFAYSLDADTDIFTAGLSWALGRHTSINLGYERRESAGALDFTYDNNITHASLLYSF